MKHFFKLFCLLLLSLVTQNPCYAQQTRVSYRLAKLIDGETNSSKSIGVLIKGNPNYVREEINRLDGHVKFKAGDITSANVSIQVLRMLANDIHIERIEEGSIQLEPMNDRMRINNKIDKVQMGMAPLPQGYDGKDVVVGIIDTGLDFMHPDFRDSLNKTRVLWIWDHILPNGPRTPATFGYGQEFTKADIDAGNASAHVDQTAHGTHVAGIATSNGRSHVEYTGAAPKSDIIAVSLDFSKNDDNWLSSIADAVQYIYSKADSLGKPCVINISAGTYFGSHDGKDLPAQMIDYLITEHSGRSLVCAAGNAGDQAFHLQHNLANDTAFTWFTQTSANGIYIEMWADTANFRNVQFAIGADNVTSGFQNRGQLPWIDIFTNQGQLKVDTLKSTSGNRLAIVQRFAQRIGKNYSMIYFVTPDSSSYYWRLMTKGTGKMDLWSFEMINSGLPAPSAYPFITKYISPDLNQTICSSFQCSDKVITVGQYVNRNNYIDVNGNLQVYPTTEGNLAASSSQGPTRDGRIKPDITSTGEQTLSALRLSSVAFFLANQPFKLAPDSIHIRDGGTSSASPAVAGAGALYFQKNPTALWSDYKTRVMVCAAQDGFTGATPNNAYGYGKLDAFAVMTGCVALALDETDLEKLMIYPNPSNDVINIYLPENLNAQSVELYNVIGEKIKTFFVSANDKKVEISRGNLAAGMYFISLITEKKTITRRVVFN